MQWQMLLGVSALIVLCNVRLSERKMDMNGCEGLWKGNICPVLKMRSRFVAHAHTISRAQWRALKAERSSYTWEMSVRSSSAKAWMWCYSLFAEPPCCPQAIPRQIQSAGRDTETIEQLLRGARCWVSMLHTIKCKSRIFSVINDSFQWQKSVSVFRWIHY